MYKFGFSCLLRNTASKKCDGGETYNNHLHSGGFKGNFR